MREFINTTSKLSTANVDNLPKMCRTFPDVAFKAGILTEEDIEQAHNLSRVFSTILFYLFPKADETLERIEDLNADLLKRYRWLAHEVLQRQWTNVRVFSPVHILLWGNATGV